MIRRANKNDIAQIINLLLQGDMVHFKIRPDIFKPNTTKYNEQDNWITNPYVHNGWITNPAERRKSSRTKK